MTASSESPLIGFHWNEAQGDKLLTRGLLTVFAYDLNDQPHAIGTAFVISRSDNKAYCATAAHVLLEVRRLQNPPARHAPSTPREFLPPPKPIDLDRGALRVVSVEGNRVEACVVEGIALDEAADIAVLLIALQTPASEPFFSHKFDLEEKSPAVGDLVCVLSYGDLRILNSQHYGTHASSFKIQSRPVLRVGHVLAAFPKGHRLCRGPCIETSIPVFSGMSGGPVVFYGTEGSMKAFGLVCSDPDPDGEQKYDRSIEGHSIIAVLPVAVSIGNDRKLISKLSFFPTDVAGMFVPLD